MCYGESGYSAFFLFNLTNTTIHHSFCQPFLHSFSLISLILLLFTANFSLYDVRSKGHGKSQGREKADIFISAFYIYI